MAGAFLTVPEEVVWADLGDALALAEALVENGTGRAVFGRAHAHAVLDVQILVGSAGSLLSGVALAAASVRVPDLGVSIARIAFRLFAEAGALLGVEEAVWTALLGLAEARASFGIEVSKFRAFLILAAAVTGLRDEFKSLWAGKGRAFAFAQGLVPNIVFIWARLNDAFESACGDVPSVLLWLGRLLRFADALAASLIPDPRVASFVVGAVIGGDALALAIVEVPEVVVGAWPSNAEAFSCKYVELFPLVVTFLHLISTGAVQVLVFNASPDKLSFSASDKLVGDTTTTRFENTGNDCNSVFYFCLSKISSNLMLGCFKG